MALAGVNCLPLPQTLTPGAGARPEPFGSIQWSGATCSRVADYARACLQGLPTGALDIQLGQAETGVPTLAADESYQLVCDMKVTRLHAASTWGALRGVATLAQLADAGQVLPGLSIDDAPRFPWRGLLIDPARHFLPVSVLQRIIDGMARLKLNVLHLHLTDDQGFRFQSLAFPALASTDHYSQDQLRTLVAYAADRGVRLVPELDMPGHVTSWLTAYPQWGAQEVAATSRFGVHKACLNPGNADVYSALQVLLAEVADVFADRYIHLGGDEVHPEWWQNDPQVAALMQQHGLADVAAVQNYFMQQVVAMVAGLGKQAIGWDEVLHADMPQMLVQNWRGMSTRDRILARRLPCLVSAPFYLDLHYPAELHYAYDPQAPQAQLLALEDAQRKDMRLQHVAQGIGWTLQWRENLQADPQDTGLVLGGEACLWSELVDEHTVDVRLWSRLPAVAERLWSAAQVRDVDSFYRRLQHLLQQPPFAMQARITQNLRSLDLDVELVECANMLEPVKWYGRLLGEQALAARIAGNEMPQARPYSVDTPLNRVVDHISPESLSARRLQAADEQHWRTLAHRWARLQPTAWPDDVQAAIQAWAQLGEQLLAYLDGQAPLSGEAVMAAYGPHGEYMLAVVPPLLQFLEQS